MDRSAPQEILAENNRPDATPPTAPLGAKARRALERAALRDLKASKRADYQRQDAEDNALIDHLRHLRNEQIEKLDQAARDLRAAYGVGVSKQRTPWIDARDEAVIAKRESRASLASARKTHNPVERAVLEELRVAHRSAQDAFDAERDALTLAHEFTICELRGDLNNARGRAGEAKQAMKTDLKAIRERDAASRAERVKAQDHARHERNAASEERWEAARKANLDYAAAVVELRDAEHAQEPAPHIEELRTKKDLARTRAEQLETLARTADLAVADRLFTERQEAQARAAFAIAAARDPWLGSKHETASEKRKARKAVRAYKAETSAERQAASNDLRHRRNAEGEAYTEAVRAVYAGRGQREAALREEYLDKREIERQMRRIAKQAVRTFEQEEKAAYRAALEEIRAQKVKVEEEFAQAVRQINCTRGVERAEERSRVREIAGDILATYEQSGRPGHPLEK